MFKAWIAGRTTCCRRGWRYVADNAAVRFIDAFVDGLDLGALGFERARPAETGRLPYNPRDLLKLYGYGYLNRVLLGPSRRRIDSLPLVATLSSSAW